MSLIVASLSALVKCTRVHILWQISPLWDDPSGFLWPESLARSLLDRGNQRETAIEEALLLADIPINLEHTSHLLLPLTRSEGDVTIHFMECTRVHKVYFKSETLPWPSVKLLLLKSIYLIEADKE